MSNNLCDFHLLRGWKCQFNPPSGRKLRGCFCWCATQLGRSIPLACHYFELWPYTPLVYLVITKKNTRAASNMFLLPTPGTTSEFHPTRTMSYLLFAFDPSVTFFAGPSTRPFPFLLEFDLLKAFWADPPRTFFSLRDCSKTLSDNFKTIWPSEFICLRRPTHRPFGRLRHSHGLTFGRHLSQPSRFLWWLIFVRSLQNSPEIMGDFLFLFRFSIFCCV